MNDTATFQLAVLSLVQSHRNSVSVFSVVRNVYASIRFAAMFVNPIRTAN